MNFRRGSSSLKHRCKSLRELFLRHSMSLQDKEPHSWHTMEDSTCLRRQCMAPQGRIHQCSTHPLDKECHYRSHLQVRNMSLESESNKAPQMQSLRCSMSLQDKEPHSWRTMEDSTCLRRQYRVPRERIHQCNTHPLDKECHYRSHLQVRSMTLQLVLHTAPQVLLLLYRMTPTDMELHLSRTMQGKTSLLHLCTAVLELMRLYKTNLLDKRHRLSRTLEGNTSLPHLYTAARELLRRYSMSLHDKEPHSWRTMEDSTCLRRQCMAPQGRIHQCSTHPLDKECHYRSHLQVRSMTLESV
jgi:uncharacterized membrane protein